MLRSEPWAAIAKECGVTASLEDISKALERAGIPCGDRPILEQRAPLGRMSGKKLTLKHLWF